MQEPVSRKLSTILEARAPAGMTRPEVVALFWKSLIDHHPQLSAYSADGLGSVDLEDGTCVRWAGCPAAGSLAVEATNLAAGDRWETFVVGLADGLRTGWRRVGVRADAPEVWEDGAVHLDLGVPVQPSREPTFLALAAAIAGSGEVRVHSSDLDERANLQAQLAHYKAVAARQAASLRELRAGSPASLEAPLAQADPAPEAQRHPRSLQDLQAWADANVDRIVILPRAIAEARKSPYQDPELVYEVLELLAETYRLVKLSKLPRHALKARCDELQVFIGGSIEPCNAGGTFASDYWVQHDGRKRFLEHHIGRGVAHDQRLTLRIYYFWSAEEGRVVVGHLPGHLSNKRS